MDYQAVPPAGRASEEDRSAPADRDGRYAGEREASDTVLAQVWWLLTDASEQVRHQAHAEGLLSAGHPLALGMELAARRAANLLTVVPADWSGPEQMPPAVLDSVVAAERLTQSLPIDDFPPGMSDLVLQLCDLVTEATAATATTNGAARAAEDAQR